MSCIPVLAYRVLNKSCKKIMKRSNNQNSTLRSIFTCTILNKKIAFNLSDIGEGIREVVVKEWFVNVGDKVSQFDNICEVQSDKASVTITSRYDGIITKLHYKTDDVALVGQPLIDLETDETDEAQTAPNSTPNVQVEVDTEPQPQIEEPDNSAVMCIPSVRRLAKENKIDLSRIEGTGKNGRILKDDILKYLNTTPSSIGTPSSKVPAESFNIEPIKGFTKAMFNTMTEALKIPSFVYSDEIKVTELSKLRRTLSSNLDVKITFLPFFIKAISNSLQRYPIINSTLDSNNENIIYWKHHNIGVAMATSNGLAVPVIKKVEHLTIVEISQELNRLMKNGKNGNFLPDDLTGANFSISNIGVVGYAVGGTYTKPVILPPQVAIIAIGATRTLPRFDSEGNITKEEIINLSATADHRILDGITVARFINNLKKQIENPNLLFLNL